AGRCCEDVCHLVDLFLEEEIFQTAKETLQELQCFCKYLQRWRDAVAARKKLRRQMRAFPAAPCGVDAADRLRALAPSAECPITAENLARGLLNLGHAGKLGVSCTRLRQLRDMAAHRMKVQHFHQQLLRDAVWAPLDLPTLVAEHLPGWREHMFWKLVLVLPDGEELSPGSPSRTLADWLKVKFMGDGGPADGAGGDAGGIQTLALASTLSSRGSQPMYVSVCVKVACGTLSDRALDAVETQKDLLGASGLLLLLPPRVQSEDLAEEDVYWLSALLQLKQLLQAKPFQPAVPLAVLAPSPAEDTVESDVEDGLMLQDLVSANLISDYTVIEIPLTYEAPLMYAPLLSYAQHILSLFLLLFCSELRIRYCAHGVSETIAGHWDQTGRQDYTGHLAWCEPGAARRLPLPWLMHALCAVEGCAHQWSTLRQSAATASERELSHMAPSQSSVKHVLGRRPLRLICALSPAPWAPVCTMVLQYASQISNSRQAQPVLQSQVESLLSRTYSRWRSRNPTPGQAAGPSVAEIPWDDFLALCIDHKLQDWAPPRLPIASEALSEDGQICVYFFKNHLKKYEVPLSWERARIQTQKEIQQSRVRSGVKSLHPPASRFPAPLLHMHLQQERNTAAGREGGTPSAGDLICGASAGEHLSQRLCSSLLLEKEESRRFKDQLQQWLSEDLEAFTDSTSLPLYLPQTLVSLPQAIQAVKTTATSPQNKRTGEQLQPSEAMGVSLTERLKHLERLIQSSREEEAASELHLSVLLDMVDI
uniref:Germinal-centre associated nuclear protein MCM3AP domain-containing protein n=1 Tax=Loxodonta africana TaxID=9785 RepID=G3U120_LOXAF